MKKFNPWTLAVCWLLAFLVGKLSEHIINIIGYDYKKCCFHLIDWVYVILFVTFTAIYIVYYFGFGKKAESDNSDKVEQSYRLPFALTIASVSLAIILMISGIIAPIMWGKADQVNTEIITNFYTAFIALCTTFVVGFQIYNSIDLNKKMEKLDAAKQEAEKQLDYLNAKLLELDSDKKDLADQIKRTSDINKKCEYFNAYSIGTIRYNEAEMNKKDVPEANKRYCWNAIRAYFNALKFASEGGQNYKEAWESFGKNKIRKCIDLLIEVHNKTDHGKNDGDNTSVMPSYNDRKRYIEDTNTAIKNIKFSDLDETLKNEYWDLVVKWNNFLQKFYSDLKS